MMVAGEHVLADDLLSANPADKALQELLIKTLLVNL